MDCTTFHDWIYVIWKILEVIMEVHHNNDRTDKEKHVCVNRETQSELFETIESLLTPSGCYKKYDVKVDPCLDNEFVIKCRNNATGNALFHITLTGWEIAAIIECMIPRIDNPLQEELRKKLLNSIGGNLYVLYQELAEKHSAFTREIKSKIKEPLKSL